MRILIIAAHPDDETIGASALLAPPHEALVLHVTDGAPRDRRWWPADVTDRAAYASTRAAEAERALAHVGAARVSLGLVDQEVVHAVGELADAISAQLSRWSPDLVVTHAYEGGHPDHDAVALAVARSRRRVSDAPRVCEMALYHGARGGITVGEFVDNRGSLRHVLDADQLARRRAMIECFASQRATTAPFLDVAHERYRFAPRYDFARPPHAGPLFYEQLGFAMTGERWRAIAADR